MSESQPIFIVTFEKNTNIIEKFLGLCGMSKEDFVKFYAIPETDSYIIDLNLLKYTESDDLNELLEELYSQTQKGSFVLGTGSPRPDFDKRAFEIRTLESYEAFDFDNVKGRKPMNPFETIGNYRKRQNKRRFFKR